MLAISIQVSVSVLRRCSVYPVGLTPGGGCHVKCTEDSVTEDGDGGEVIPGGLLKPGPKDTPSSSDRGSMFEFESPPSIHGQTVPVS